MSKRSITDEEIGLIKAMLARKMKNKDIQFFFNRPNRPVNTGRISAIHNGTYSNSAAIAAASDADLDSFISHLLPKAVGGGDADSPSSGLGLSGLVRALFGKGPDGVWRLVDGESDRYECKLDFDPSKMTSTVRAAAALANNKGGFIFFGISDDKYQVEGAGKTFFETDVVRIIDKIKAHLSPTPSVTTKGMIELDGKRVGFLHVERHLDRPIMVYRGGDGLNESDILFRYPGQSARIKFGDLRAILEERDRRAQAALAKVAGRIADVGTNNALIVDTEKNVLDAQGRTILIDEELAKNIKFIKEGQFDPGGAPTLKLVGEVSAVSVTAPVKERLVHEAIFQEHILDAFLNQAKVDQPLQYVKAGLAQSRQWLPIFYFVRQASRTNGDAIEVIKSLRVSQKGKKKILLERLEGKKTALTKAVTHSAKKIAADIADGVLTIPTAASDVATFASAVTAVSSTKAPLVALLAALQSCKALADVADDGNALGALFKAACRIDEIFFSKA